MALVRISRNSKELTVSFEVFTEGDYWLTTQNYEQRGPAVGMGTRPTGALSPIFKSLADANEAVYSARP